jgi:branched-chain amino acid transport system ATP-binding protein
MPEPMLAIRKLTKRFGGLAANADVTLDIAPGETRAIIGPNGAGKTTLLSQLAGELRPDEGTILFSGADITRLTPRERSLAGIARSFQITSIMPSLSVLENVVLGALSTQGRFLVNPWRPASRNAAAQGLARSALDQVGLSARAEFRASDISHGERRQLELAIALATRPRLLLLDEPTAGMGREESRRVIRLIEGLKSTLTIVLVEHDMDVVFSVSDKITVMAGGTPIATGTPDEIRGDPKVREAYLGTKGATT